MKLHVINSNSKGNCYTLTDNKGNILIIEAGVNINRIKEAISFNIDKVAGVLLTHEHLDHSRSVADLVKYGLNVYTSEGTKDALKSKSRNILAVPPMKKFRIGSYTVMPFDVKHDCAQPYGFLIQHEEMGLTLFMTDTYYCEYKFSGLNNIIIEANYCEDIIDRKLSQSSTTGFVRDRVMQSHMSIQTCIKTLKEYDLKHVNNIVVIHLSDGNSNEIEFKNKVRSATGCSVHIADKGLTINFDKVPF